MNTLPLFSAPIERTETDERYTPKWMRQKKLASWAALQAQVAAKYRTDGSPT